MHAALLCAAVVLLALLVAFAAGGPRGRAAARAAAPFAVGIAAGAALGLAARAAGCRAAAEDVLSAAPGAGPETARGGAPDAVGLFARLRRLAAAPATRAEGARALGRVRSFLDAKGRGFGRAAMPIVERGPPGDAATIAALRRAWERRARRGGPPRAAAGAPGAREDSRLAAVRPLLAPVAAAAAAEPDFRLLDVGSAEGRITAALARFFRLPRDRAVACDVTPQAATAPSFVFVRADGVGLPAPDASFDLVAALMSSHHFADAPAMYREMARVARPGAYLLLREHDGGTPGDAIFYDVVHAVYECVLGDESSPAEFAAAYQRGATHYRSVAAWVELAESVGFRPVGAVVRTGDRFDAAYALLRLAPAAREGARAPDAAVTGARGPDSSEAGVVGGA